MINTLRSSIRSYHFRSPDSLISVNSAASVLTLIDSKTASIIVACIGHSKFDCCNSLYYNLSKSQINRLQQIQNSLAQPCALHVKAAKFSNITPFLKSLHWLKINERTEYKLLSLTYSHNQPTGLPIQRDLCSVYM